MTLINQTYRTPTIPDVVLHFTQAEGVARIDMDTLDKAGFPRKGFLGRAEGRATGTPWGTRTGLDGFLMAMGAISSERHTVQIKANGATIFIHRKKILTCNGWADFYDLGGYSQNSLVGTEKALAQTQYLYKIGNLGGMPFYGGMAGEWARLG